MFGIGLTLFIVIIGLVMAGGRLGDIAQALGRRSVYARRIESVGMVLYGLAIVLAAVDAGIILTGCLGSVR